MPPVPEARVLQDRKRLPASFYHKIGITFLALTFLVGVIYVGCLYYAGPMLKAQQEKSAVEAYINNLMANAQPFAFQIVPDALTSLKMPEQVNNADVTAQLNEEFTLARSGFVDPGDTEVPNIFDMPVGEITYLEYMNEMPRELQDPFLQMQSEIEVLVATLNKSYSQETLASRIGKKEALIFSDATLNTEGEVSVYPSLRVAQAHFAAEILARQLPSQADFFREFADSYIQSGVAYGHYSQLDAKLTEMLIDDYLNEVAKSPSGSIVIQSIEQ
jgi:hypothetical protein